MQSNPLSENGWWEAWIAWDYSWAGLALKPIHGWVVDRDRVLRPRATEEDPAARPATLQDFWADEQHHLVGETDRSGNLVRQWTRFHLPLDFPDGRPAKRQWSGADWQALEDGLRPVLAKSKLGYRVTALAGLVLRRPLGPIGHDNVQYVRCAFLGTGGTADEFDNVLYEDCLIDGPISLDGSTGLSSMTCWRTVFTGDVTLTDLNAGAISFAGSSFAGALTIGQISLDNLGLTACSVAGALSIYAVEARWLALRNATLRSVAGRNAKIQTADFDGLHVAGEVTLVASQIGQLSLNDGEVGGFMRLGLTAGRVVARRLEVHKYLLIAGSVDNFLADNMTVHGSVDFNGCVFAESVSLTGIKVGNLASFRNVTWPNGTHSGIFRNTTFQGLADFRGQTPPSPAAFDGCFCRSEVRFSRAAFKGDNGFHAALDKCKHNEAVESLENGSRVLKLVAEGLRDRLSEHRFHRYELMARRRNALTPRTERFFSTLYGVAGDYGGSLVRPLLNLGLLWLLFALVFALWGCLVHSDLPSVWTVMIEAMESSARNIFHPLNVWTRPPPVSQGACTNLETALTWCSSDAARLLFRVAATVESLCAGILVFLTGLAIKRRFQIA